MSACELFRGGVSKPDGTRAVIAIVFDPYLPRELNVKVHFLQTDQECSDFEVYIAEALATSSTAKQVLQQRAQELGNALQLEYTSRGNGAPTLFIAADAVHAPPITLTRGVKVQVQTSASNSTDEWRLGKISRARQDGSVNVQFLDATKEYSVPRSRLRVMGRYRPGQYKGYLADAQTNAHASKTQNVGFTGAFDMDQRSIYEAASIKIQTVYRSHLARSVLNWLRGKRANTSANVAPARYGTPEPILNRDPAKLPPEPKLPPLPHRLAPESINATSIPISANVQGEGLLQASQHVSLLPSTARTQTPRSARPPAGPPNSPATQVEASASLSSSSLSSSSSESSLSTSSDEDDESDDAEDVEVIGNARHTAAESKHSDIMAKRPIKKKHTAPSRAPPAKHTSLPSREAPATQRFTPSHATSGQETSFKSREKEEKEFAETKTALQVHASATISTKTGGTSSAQQAPRRHSSPAVSSPKSPSTIPEEPVAAVAERIGSTGKVKVYSVTFNAHSKGRQALAGDVIAKMIAPGYDMYCLAFQDLRTGGDPLRETLTSILPPAYIELRGVSMQRMHLFIYIHASLLPLVKDVQSDHVFFGVDLGNETSAPKGERIKGAVAISFEMRGKSFVFVNSHFKGQPTDDASRDANFHEINVRFKLPLNKLQTTTPISQRFDFAWWLGDLNYRVHLDSMVPSVAESHKVLNEGNLGKLLERDGLLNNNHAFEDYEEMPISFPPTFRFNQTTGEYCDKSVPSWTDRILIKRDQPECAWLSYGMLNAVCTSVHKPVFAAHAVTLAEPHGIWSDWHAAQAELMKRVQAEADAAAKANLGVSAGTSKSVGLGAKVLGGKGKSKAAQQQEVSFRMDTEVSANKSRACVIQ